VNTGFIFTRLEICAVKVVRVPVRTFIRVLSRERMEGHLDQKA
jgi:hypothetical protein